LSIGVIFRILCERTYTFSHIKEAQMNINYQDTFLNTIRRENIPITIFLTSGFQIRCNLRAFDAYVLVVDVDGKQQMIFKHAISTIAPLKVALKIQNGE